MNFEVIVTCAVTGAGDTTGRSEHVPVTPKQIADALATGIGQPIRYEVQPLDEVAAFGDDMVRMYEWFNEGGYSVDIAALRSELPDVTFHTVDEFAQAHDWDAILRR